MKNNSKRKTGMVPTLQSFQTSRRDMQQAVLIDQKRCCARPRALSLMALQRLFAFQQVASIFIVANATIRPLLLHSHAKTLVPLGLRPTKCPTFPVQASFLYRDRADKFKEDHFI